MRVGDAVVLPFNETAKDIDVRKIVGIVVSVNSATVSVINGYGATQTVNTSEAHLIAAYEHTLLQFTQKGVELVDKVKQG